MREMVVAKPFVLSLPGKEPQRFDVGVHKDVPDEVADHWFAKPHLAKDGKLPEPAPTAPLTNEERASVKASLDAAEKRAVDAELRAKTAEDQHGAIKAGMEKLVADNEALRSKVSSLEADLDKATKPATLKPAAAPAK